MKNRLLRHIGSVLLTASLLALAACGGGGGGGKAQSVLDAQSDQDIARRIISVGGLIFGMGEGLADGALGGLSAAIAGGVTSGPVLDTCTTGGATMTITDAGEAGVFDAGDAIEISFNNCSSDGDTINGKIRLEVTSLTDGFVYDTTGTAGVKVTFTNLSTQTTEDGKPVTYTLDGSWDGSLTYENGGAKVTFVAQVPANGSFSLSRSEQGGDQAAMTAQGLTETAVIDQGANSYTLDFDADTITFTAGSYAQASFKVTTDPLIRGPLDMDGDPGDPTEGTILVEEKNGRAAMKLEIMSGSQVKVSVDADGDGVFESSETVSWTALAGD